MNDTESRPRRSLVVVLLDGVLRLYAAVQAGPTPTPKVRVAGARPGAGRYLLLTGALVALAGTVLLVVVLAQAPGGPNLPPEWAAALPDPRTRPAEPSVTGPSATALPTTTAPSRSAKPVTTTSAATPKPSSRPSAPITEGTAAPLTASHRTSSATVGLLGYRMTVTVANPGTTPADGWTLTVTLPRPTLLVADVTGASAAQDGSVWTFTPDATTTRVPAGGSVELDFEVRGATLIDAAPRDCRIDGNRCAS